MPFCSYLLRVGSVVVDGCVSGLDADVPEHVVEALDDEQEEPEQDDDGTSDEEDNNLIKKTFKLCSVSFWHCHVSMWHCCLSPGGTVMSLSFANYYSVISRFGTVAFPVVALQ